MLSPSIPHDSRFAAVEKLEELLKEIQHVEQKIGRKIHDWLQAAEHNRALS